MFARIKRFFLALRILRKQAREERVIRYELNLDHMGALVGGMTTKSPREEELNMGFSVLMKADGPEATEEDAKRILEESKIEYTYPSNSRDDSTLGAQDALKKHNKKFTR
jgi:hypothetical protein